jgi:Common central domain of tyrosinase
MELSKLGEVGGNPMKIVLPKNMRISFCAGLWAFTAACLVAPNARAQWGGWESLGGIILETPDCTSWGANRIDCFGRGTDAAMWHRWWDGAAWGGWESLGGDVLEQPDCVNWGADRIDCLARGTDRAMWHRWWDGAAWGGGWENLGGVVLDRPGCVSWGANRLDCFARGTDRAMWHRWWDGAAWGGWESLGGVLLDAPSCVSWGPNRIDCFARGTDQAMLHRWWDGAAWGGWESLGGVILDPPDCISWGANRIDCFARGTDQAMLHRWWDGANWGGWESLGGVVLDPPSCVSWGTNRIDCFARGTDAAMWHRWWDGANWGGWESLGGVILDRPDCTSWGANRLDCFARGTDRAMWHRWWPCPECIVATAQRKSVTDLTASELMSLRRGVAKMMSRNGAPRGSADYRRSWLYWANMHLHFGSDCAGPISGSGMAGVQTFTASNADETATWCKCEHGTDQFLTWHRMYLWYFERVLQEAAADPSLRLPYWDYEANAVLPAAYRDATYVDEAGHTVPNPLRVEARQPGLNNGTSSLSSGVTSTAGAMLATSFNPFSSSLEATPHGAVHCAIVTGSCPNGLMGSVPVAALDPIFYAHHTNIDRLYDCWLQVNQATRLPSDPIQLAEMFTFVDADGSTPQRRVGDMLTTTQLGYTYAGGGGCPASLRVAALAQTMTVADPAPMTPVAEQALAFVGPTHLDRAVTTVPLAVSAPAREALARHLAPSTPGHVELAIEGVQYDEAPGGLYNVYLQSVTGQRVQVGVINFFGMAPSGAAGHAAHAGHARTQGNFRFEVADAVKQLNISSDVQPSLVFELTTGLTEALPGASGLQMNAQANVRFESARLVNTP